MYLLSLLSYLLTFFLSFAPFLLFPFLCYIAFYKTNTPNPPNPNPLPNPNPKLSPTLTLKQKQVWDARVSLPNDVCPMKYAPMREMTQSVAVVLVSVKRKRNLYHSLTLSTLYHFYTLPPYTHHSLSITHYLHSTTTLY